MNIYYVIWNYPSSEKCRWWCGDVTVVAANSKEEAKGFLQSLKNKHYMQIYDIDYIYKLENATIDCKEPKILIDEGYVE